MTQEALKLALEELAVRFSKGWHEGIKIDASDIMLLNEAAQALAQPEQEPRNVRERWNVELDGNDLLVCFNDHEKGDKCQYERYSPQRTWVGLAAEDRLTAKYMQDAPDGIEAVIDYIEAKLKELNT